MTLLDLSIVPWHTWVGLSLFLFFSGLGILMAGASLHTKSTKEDKG